MLFENNLQHLKFMFRALHWKRYFVTWNALTLRSIIFSIHKCWSFQETVKHAVVFFLSSLKSRSRISLITAKSTLYANMNSFVSLFDLCFRSRRPSPRCESTSQYQSQRCERQRPRICHSKWSLCVWERQPWQSKSLCLHSLKVFVYFAYFTRIPPYIFNKKLRNVSLQTVTGSIN